MSDNAVSIGQELLNVPFPEMVKNLGVGIAEAQLELDMVSTRIAQLMTGNVVNVDAADEQADEGEQDGMTVKLGDGEYSLLELGFTPTFYQFVDTIIEVKMAVSVKREQSQSTTTKKKSITGRLRLFRGSASVSVSSVNASYASKYQYSAEGSSLMRTKLVPVPPPQLMEEIMREHALKRSDNGPGL